MFLYFLVCNVATPSERESGIQVYSGRDSILSEEETTACDCMGIEDWLIDFYELCICLTVPMIFPDLQIFMFNYLIHFTPMFLLTCSKLRWYSILIMYVLFIIVANSVL